MTQLFKSYSCYCQWGIPDRSGLIRGENLNFQSIELLIRRDDCQVSYDTHMELLEKRFHRDSAVNLRIRSIIDHDDHMMIVVTFTFVIY